MIYKISLMVASLFIATNAGIIHTDWIAYGPMLRLNIGSGDARFSWGFEIAYIKQASGKTVDERSFYGLNTGMEFERGKSRLFGEYQNVSRLFGLSIGPVYEFEFGNDKNKFGIQGGVGYILLPDDEWVGIDCKIRYLSNSRVYISPGLYAKIPLDLEMDIRGN